MIRDEPQRIFIDRLAILIAPVALYALAWLPFVVLKPNRIVQGEGISLLGSLPPPAGGVAFFLVAAAALAALMRLPPWMKLAVNSAALLALVFAAGSSAYFLTPAGNTYARISPSSGFWIAGFCFTLLIADAIAKLKPRPMLRIALLALTVVIVAALLKSGMADGLSIMKEYGARAEVFRVEAEQHVALAMGSLILALVSGLPLGILCHRVPPLKAFVLNVLNLIQTIPSIALFGILIGPLAWISANVPGAAAAGVRGIGAAPAFVALLLYSLLPVVANTVVGLAAVPREANDAARGMGMTEGQRLFRVELPLALPVILTAVRIVLVQNIGMATIAALIGGGGFGVFVFQGIGQTAMDLVLLGAVPTVALAFVAAVVLDALIERTQAFTRGAQPT